MDWKKCLLLKWMSAVVSITPFVERGMSIVNKHTRVNPILDHHIQENEEGYRRREVEMIEKRRILYSL